MDCPQLIKTAELKLMDKYQLDFQSAQPYMIHNALSEAIMEEIAPEWKKSKSAHEQVRRAYYFSAEYLMGRMIYNNLYSLGILDNVKKLLANKGVDIALFDETDDVALGNGGLGRLAACFLDSAATHNLPLDGYGLRYKYGLFRQKIENGFQVEYPDDWQKYGDPWSRRREDEAVSVCFGETIVTAVPYDMPIIGFRTNNISTLRLFQCEAINGFDLSRFNNYEYFLSVHDKNIAENITSVLYPSDNSYDGKRLRLMQQYLLSSAGMQDILKRYKKGNNNIYNFDAHCAIQLNDTHPTLAIPELIRLLINEGLSFEDAFDIAKRTFSYTNHTIMSESLEKWDMNLFCSVLPNMYDIVCRINQKLNKKLFEVQMPQEHIYNMQIVKNDKIYMANLAAFMCCHINGVAKIHTNLLTNTVLSSWYKLYPDKFSNKTNGITQRRFLGVCNPLLVDFLKDYIGNDNFLTNLSVISKLKNNITPEMISRFGQIKQINKKNLSDKVYSDTGIYLPPEFIFDVQIKRLHEYKRQLMNAFSIYGIYLGLKNNELNDFTPSCYIFAAKAASGYFEAKAIIKYINELAKLINNDLSVNNKLRVVFIPNYNCSYAEQIIPAADISEQISPVGTEASGTGNMKLMLNGAVTLGTNDGANIEIAQLAGYENNYIFYSDDYHYNSNITPLKIYNNNKRIHEIIDSLIDGTFSDEGSGMFRKLYEGLIYDKAGQNADKYYILRDFNNYYNMKLRANSEYRNTQEFYKKCMANTLSAGYFSSDRTIKEYAEDIWHIYKINN